MKARVTPYLVARLKLAFGRTMAALADVIFLRREPAAGLVRIGTEYGGWYCCRALLGPDRTAMCCGAGEDISFDAALNAKWGMRIICVDPTPRSIRHVESFLAAGRDGRPMLIEAGPLGYEMNGFREANFTFVPCAVWSSDGVLDLFAPRDPAHVSYSAVNLQHTSEVIQVRSSTVGSLLRDFGVVRLSLLKLDIEGAEYEVLRSMLGAGILPEQLLVEFDQINQPQTPFFWIELVRILRTLRGAGYRLVHRERANYVFVLSSALER
ncbi:MAG: FkbM family methyltransferase [Steroidobacteraceae bacterium]